MNVQNVFLNGHLLEEVYMAQPPGFVHHLLPNRACKLHRSLCGLKQSPRVWYSRLSQLVRELGFCSSQADHSLFINQDGSHMTFLLVYVERHHCHGKLIVSDQSGHDISQQTIRYERFRYSKLLFGHCGYLSRGFSSSRFVVSVRLFLSRK